jgi:uncharacterized protein (TIGR02145 family)
MTSKDNLTPLTVSNYAVYKAVDGITYFKLKSKFDGDYTKHCGLLGEEIDENFYFLRGYDIESIYVDDNRNLIINRVDKDYQPLIVNIGDKLGQPKFNFNRAEGVITIEYPDGTSSKMDGFFVEGRDIIVATDNTLKGNGTMFNPLRLSTVEKTGTFSSASEYLDLTNITHLNQMPDGKYKGYRVVTKEKIDNFGCLYPYTAVEKIQRTLEENGSQWRVPSKADWDELLNSLECAEDRNHDSMTCTWLGMNAGSGLKSSDMWKTYENLPNETPTDGQDIMGLSIYPVGITPDRNEIIGETDYDAEGFTKMAGMWTSTKLDDGNAYAKIFGYNSSKVDQDTYGEGSKMSIRLVKDYDLTNYEAIETILGYPYPTVLVYGIHEDYSYAKIWTKINLYSDANALGGIRSDEWSAVTDSDRGIKDVYFINEWNGSSWDKKPMNDGDSIVIVDKDNLSYHEWRIVDNELVDTFEELSNEFKTGIETVRGEIEILSNKTQELVIFCGVTVDTINEFSGTTEEHINRLDSRIDSVNETVSELSASTVAEVTRINHEISLLNNIASTVSSITTSNIERIDADVISVSGSVDTVSAITSEFSASTVAEVARIDADVVSINSSVDTLSAETVAFSASTVAEVARIDADVVSVNSSVDTLSAETIAFSAYTVAEVARIDKKVNDEADARIANDITPGTYVLNGDSSIEMVIPTNSDAVSDVKIKVSDEFFNFGEF